MYTLNCGGKLLLLDKPVVMGIINVTPDSFFAGSRAQAIDDVLRQAEKMTGEGAVILDMGGQSTRPGSSPVAAAEESHRVIPAIRAVSERFPELIISVDTYYASVAEEAASVGAGIVNDISAGTLDADLLPTVARLGLPYIAMHMKGHPSTMQTDPLYENVTREVTDFFIGFSERLRLAGIDEWVLDPGFGFGKTIDHNFQLIRDLSAFQLLDRPVLMGISRKSTVYRTLGISAAEALNGTTVLHTLGLQAGVHILRAHDVREAREAIQLVERVREAGK